MVNLSQSEREVVKLTFTRKGLLLRCLFRAHSRFYGRSTNFKLFGLNCSGIVGAWGALDATSRGRFLKLFRMWFLLPNVLRRRFSNFLAILNFAVEVLQCRTRILDFLDSKLSFPKIKNEFEASSTPLQV